MILKKPLCGILFCLALFTLNNTVFGQVYSRPRIAPPTTQPNPTTQSPSQPTVRTTVSQRPALTNDVRVVTENPSPQLVKKTADIRPNNLIAKYLKSSVYSAQTTQQMLNSIQSKLGIRYVYGTEGPYSYDCSGFVWSVFQSAGINFERTSARSLWQMSEPVSEEEKYKFGTLVFFNRLGHVGIVADENGFYHASSSKGITYSPFAGYWSKRIVGFRRLNLQPEKPQPETVQPEKPQSIKPAGLQ
jgi:Cell wall-associated hydrolases (invasion-associated proteins)